jgi:hypothetical protein
MSNYSAGRGPRPADPYPRLRLAALTAVIAGVVVLAAAAFVLSYAGIHQIALRAGVSPELAKLYPVIFDAMLVVSGAAVLALRGASGWARAYAWSSLLLMLVAVAVGDALHTTNVSLPGQPTRVVVAITPWVLLLLAFGLWLTMLQHLRRLRAANGQHGQGPGQPVMTGGAPAAGQGANGITHNGVSGNGDSGAAQRAAVTWAGADGAGQGRPLPPPLAGLDALLGPREASRPALPGTGRDDPAAAGNPEQADAGQYLDPVSYGAETGYVHPDSYLVPADYSRSAAVAQPDGEPGEQLAPGPGPSEAQPGSPAAADPGTAEPTAAPSAAASPAAAPSAAAPPAAAPPAAASPGAAPSAAASPAAAPSAAASPAAAPSAAASPAAAPPAAAPPVAAPPAAASPAAASPAPHEPQPAPEKSPVATAKTAAAEGQTAPDNEAHQANGQDPPSPDGDTTRATAAADPGPGWSACGAPQPGPRR